MLRIYTFLFIVTMLSSCSLFFLPYLELNHNTYDIKIHRASLLKITVYDNNGQILNKSFDCLAQELNLTEILNPEKLTIPIYLFRFIMVLMIVKNEVEIYFILRILIKTTLSFILLQESKNTMKK